MTLSQQPPTAAPEPSDGLTDTERDALARAAATGTRSADWIHSLAQRQPDPCNQQALHRYADAVEQVLTREIVPGGDGDLAEQLRHTLDALVLRGSTLTTRRPDLTAAERVALLAVGFAALTAPLAAVGDLAGDLEVLCEAIDQALAFGQAD
jgi:hypothetical protein